MHSSGGCLHLASTSSVWSDADVPNPGKHSIRLDQNQVTVVDLHNLNDRAKRFVVGVTLRRAFAEKERAGQNDELLMVVLDELNKYAPREGASPIKEILLDIAERGRSLGVILIGAQQTASEVERRIIANSSIRVVGRLDSAEAAREEYGLPPGGPSSEGDHRQARDHDSEPARTASSTRSWSFPFRPGPHVPRRPWYPWLVQMTGTLSKVFELTNLTLA